MDQPAVKADRMACAERCGRGDKENGESTSTEGHGPEDQHRLVPDCARRVPNSTLFPAIGVHVPASGAHARLASLEAVRARLSEGWRMHSPPSKSGKSGPEIRRLFRLVLHVFAQRPSGP